MSRPIETWPETFVAALAFTFLMAVIFVGGFIVGPALLEMYP